MCLFIVLLSILYHASLNSRACFVFASSDNQSARYEMAEQYLFHFSKEFYNYR